MKNKADIRAQITQLFLELDDDVKFAVFKELGKIIEDLRVRQSIRLGKVFQAWADAHEEEDCEGGVILDPQWLSRRIGPRG